MALLLVAACSSGPNELPPYEPLDAMSVRNVNLLDGQVWIGAYVRDDADDPQSGRQMWAPVMSFGEFALEDLSSSLAVGVSQGWAPWPFRWKSEPWLMVEQEGTAYDGFLFGFDGSMQEFFPVPSGRILTVGTWGIAENSAVLSAPWTEYGNGLVFQSLVQPSPDYVRLDSLSIPGTAGRPVNAAIDNDAEALWILMHDADDGSCRFKRSDYHLGEFMTPLPYEFPGGFACQPRASDGGSGSILALDGRIYVVVREAGSSLGEGEQAYHLFAAREGEEVEELWTGSARMTLDYALLDGDKVLVGVARDGRAYRLSDAGVEELSFADELPQPTNGTLADVDGDGVLDAIVEVAARSYPDTLVVGDRLVAIQGVN